MPSTVNYDVESIVSCSGSRFESVYKTKIEDDGTISFEVIGQDDVYERIQSFAESCDINVILKRFQKGDSSVLSQVQGFYADVTGAPKTYAQMLQAVIDGQDMFSKLPADLRAEFGNDFYRFFSTMDSQEWQRKVAAHVKPVPTPTVDSAPRVDVPSVPDLPEVEK